MTTQITQSPSASGPASSAPTGSREVIPFNDAPIAFYDARFDDLPVTGAVDEFDIDDYIAGQDQNTRDALRDARSWVADAVYPEGRTLAALRLKAGLSQRDLAEKCGLKQPHVSRYEAGRHEPGVFQAQAMAKELGVSLDAFVEALKNSKLQSCK